jgi:hypothetical protein
MMKQTLGIVVILGGLSMAGCAGGYAYYSSAPPPPVRVEARGVAPGAGFVWVDGYWGYRGGNYAWVPGNWVRPPRARAVWVPGRWEMRRGRYYYRQGRWR